MSRFAYEVCTCSFDEIEDVQEYDNAHIILNRFEDNTILKMNDLSDKKNPFIRHLHIPQSEKKWIMFNQNIKLQNNYIYIAVTKSKAIEKELENGNLKNITFISKVKVA